MRRRCLSRIGPYLLPWLLIACGGKSNELLDAPAGAPAHEPPAVTTAGGAGAAPMQAGGAGGTGTAGGGRTMGGASAVAAGEAGQSGTDPECALDRDCRSPSECLFASCTNERCELRPIVFGTRTSAQAAGDCRSNVCDGNGATITVSDPDDVPVSASSCLSSACRNAGPELVPSVARTTCALENKSGLCDGSGSCVECLADTDCAVGSVCGKHTCVVIDTCSDSQRSGDETGVDCGGPDCAPCGDHEACRIDQDCESDLCDPLLYTCLPLTCRDGVQNGDETDVDCGGATCAGCYVAKRCNVAHDCATLVCNAGACAGNACQDGRQDGRETDVDCGGLECAPCLSGQRCHSNFDCSDFQICARLQANGPKVCQ